MLKFSTTALSFTALLSIANAHAELGGAVIPVSSTSVSPSPLASTAATPQPQIKVTMRTQAATATASAYAVQQVAHETGTIVREYADTNGTVFAVSWQGPVKPDLKQLLGQYFQPFIDGSAASQHVGTGPITLRDTNLVVHSGGHPRAFFGSAYVPTLIPQGVVIDALQ